MDGNIDDLIDLSHFEIRKKLDHGQNWKFYEIYNNSNRNKNLAKVSRYELAYFDKHARVSLYHEVEINSRLTHPSILKYIGYNMQNFKDKPKPIIITEYPSNGSLSNFFYQRYYSITPNWTDTKRLINIYGIASSMSYLHTHNILHRNLSLKSIFLDEFFYPKLSGFDFSIEITDEEPIKGSKIVGDTEYLSPEILNNLEYSKSSDVFAFSFLISNILGYKIRDSNFKIIEDDKSFEISEEKPFGDGFQKIIDDYFSTEPENRPSFDQMVSDMMINPDFMNGQVDMNEFMKFAEIMQKDEFNRIGDDENNDKKPYRIRFQNLIDRCRSDDPKLRPTFDQIVTEIKTNPEYLTENIDIEEFQNYVEFIEKSKKSYVSRNRKRKLDEILKSDFLKFQWKPTDFLINIDITKYKIISTIDHKHEYKILKTCFIDDKGNKSLYSSQVYFKEICDFYRNEIINFYRKLNIMSQINHPTILNIVGFSPVSFNNEPNCTIVTEFSYQNLDLKIISRLNDTQKLTIIFGIASAMAYLHSHDIIHRDLKPENIYLNDDLLPKLSGFDIAIDLNDHSIDDKFKIKGTPAYLAPEVYLKKEYSKESDVYSFAQIMYEIFTGTISLKEKSTPIQIKKEVAENGERSIFYEPIYSEYRRLIEQCWSHNPDERPTFDQILTELKTNPKFITENIDSEFYYGYIKSIENSPFSFDKTKRIKIFDEMISRDINTFQEIDPYLSLLNMYETEINDLSFEYNFYNIIKDQEIKYQKKGIFYVVNDLNNYETGEKYVLKHPILDIKDLSKDEIENFTQEIEIISQLNHPSILKFYGYTPTILNQNKPSIILEFAIHGSFYGDILYSFDELTEIQKMKIIYQTAAGMSYLHSHGIIHRDLKPKNIYFDKDYNVKISGFNIAINLENQMTIKCKKIKGSPAYLAPEVYLNKEYSKASDVYSFAIAMYEILTLKYPFSDLLSPLQIKKEVAENGKRPTFEEPINDFYRNLIERCWSQNPEERPTFDQILLELKANPEFQENEEFLECINSIENAEISFDPTNKITHIETMIKYDKPKFYERTKDKFNFRNIYETELNDVLFNYDFIDIRNYVKNSLIKKTNDWELFSIMNNDTEQLFLARKMTLLFSPYQEEVCYNYRNIWFNKTNDLLELNHPSLLNFVGYSPEDLNDYEVEPLIITEYGSNGSLENILDMDIRSQSFSLLNETKRLIIIYGIASAMSYLHSHGISHCNLSPLNIFLDDFLFPKVSILHITRLKGFDIEDFDELVYTAPEFLEDQIYRPEADVYSFAIIVLQLISNEKPFQNVTEETIQQIYSNNLKPTLKNSIPQCYRKLIEKCWVDNPKERPSFDEILYHIRTNPEFINDNIDQKEFQNYVDMFDKVKNITKIDDYIGSSDKTFRKVKIDINKIRNSVRLKFSVNMGSIDLNLFQKEKELGSGAYGVVFLITEKETGKKYAAKIAQIDTDECDKNTIIDLTREIYIISQLHHPSILNFIGYNPRSFKNNPHPVIVMELAPNGSLDDVMKQEKKGLSNSNWNDTKKLINIYGIAAGMAYMHKHNILHRDLKPANILLDEYLFPKISDFGLSKVLYHQDSIKDFNNILTSQVKGTLFYIAPEIFSDNEYTKAGDVYAFGHIVFEIITGQELYDKNVYYFKFMNDVCHGARPEFKVPVPYCFKKLIEKCWDHSPEKRPEFSRIVEILETDKNFITSNVDEDEYHEYIKFIKEKLNNDKIDNYPQFIKIQLDMNSVEKIHSLIYLNMRK